MMISESKFKINDKLFFNYVEGEPCTVIGLVIYNSHVEYLVFSERGTAQYSESQLSETKIF